MTVISKGSDCYWIYSSETATYDPKITTLTIYNCSIDEFKMNSKLIEPVKSYKHINCTFNFEKNIETMTSLRLDDEIEKFINKMFEESLVAGEKLDFDKMKRQVNDKFSSGFINDGKYYKTFDLLFAEYNNTAHGIKNQKLTIETKKVTILSENSVLLTANGKFSAITASNSIVNGNFAWTIIYYLIDNEWKIIHTNMSNSRQ